MKYFKIVDAGECYSTLMESVNDIPANREEWAKHNFYPQNDMVGKFVKMAWNGANIIQFDDGIFVPMSNRGIVEITEQEYKQKKGTNPHTGMNERQKKINADYDNTQEKTKQGYYSKLLFGE